MPSDKSAASRRAGFAVPAGSPSKPSSPAKAWFPSPKSRTTHLVVAPAMLQGGWLASAQRVGGQQRCSRTKRNHDEFDFPDSKGIARRMAASQLSVVQSQRTSGIIFEPDRVSMSKSSCSDLRRAVHALPPPKRTTIATAPQQMIPRANAGQFQRQYFKEDICKFVGNGMSSAWVTRASLRAVPPTRVPQARCDAQRGRDGHGKFLYMTVGGARRSSEPQDVPCGWFAVCASASAHRNTTTTFMSQHERACKWAFMPLPNGMQVPIPHAPGGVKCAMAKGGVSGVACCDARPLTTQTSTDSNTTATRFCVEFREHSGQSASLSKPGFATPSSSSPRLRAFAMRPRRQPGWTGAMGNQTSDMAEHACKAPRRRLTVVVMFSTGGGLRPWRVSNEPRSMPGLAATGWHFENSDLARFPASWRVVACADEAVAPSFLRRTFCDDEAA
ncbi:hypothetical protein M409DRAFT_52798 [Zasmidium cellare ATCC 36951]|uniref:Uncharacterized protein n=1 Tax=Zasmidium cellare ATCC 36951 TaxID=1080233 RepID=A0A6A6CNT4_ZASCE|nr:uncharacterized protein M409DRAFT_52798 [Zasmidium cellare ATCC 36951]KAF2168784.1 hypothetical protein M409DRAFT_52798 [Zasmidium cellare ATCC 36951]